MCVCVWFLVVVFYFFYLLVLLLFFFFRLVSVFILAGRLIIGTKRFDYAVCHCSSYLNYIINTAQHNQSQSVANPADVMVC